VDSDDSRDGDNKDDDFHSPEKFQEKGKVVISYWVQSFIAYKLSFYQSQVRKEKKVAR
jgi:hypothetical protein